MSNSKLPLLPKATCLWLIENTSLTFKQIAIFCGIHELEVIAVADGEVNWWVQPVDPIINGQLTKEEIERCSKDEKTKLMLNISSASELMDKNSKKRKARYTPINKRQDKPNAIAWLVKNYPGLKDSQIKDLIGTTKATITSIREKTHKNIKNIKAVDPVILGLTTQTNLNNTISTLKLETAEDSNYNNSQDK